jgi:ATP-binding protein involved in chromosome partitioning
MSAFTGKEQMPAKKEEGKPSAAENLKDVKHKIIVMSGKGGVGKSTVAVNLATALVLAGKKVGLLDADMHGPSVPKLFGLKDGPMAVNENGKILPIKTASNVKIISIALLLEDSDAPIIWRGPVKMGAIKQFLEEVEWGELDYLIVDLPPGTGDEPLSVAQLVPSPDGAVIVTTPQDVALLSVRKSISFAKAVGLRPIGLVQNMDGFVCPNCNEKVEVFGNGGAQTAAKDFGIPLLGSLPLSPEIANSGDEGRPFAAMDDDVAKRFRTIADRIAQITEDGGRK